MEDSMNSAWPVAKVTDLESGILFVFKSFRELNHLFSINVLEVSIDSSLPEDEKKMVGMGSAF
jgi:hypothetical protein